MSEKTGIAWTHHTFNIAWGCVKVSPGCKNCYADSLSARYGHHVWGPNKPRRTFREKHWREPLKWHAKAASEGERRRVFCSSMCDVFEDHPTIDQERAKLWPLIRQTPWLDWLLLTKRPERIATNLPEDWRDGYPNVWLGTSIESNDYAWRANFLRDVPAAVRFVSYEPALGSLDQLELAGIDWVIFGGESGNNSKNFRPQDMAWPRQMRDKCASAGTAFFYKQTSNIRTEMGTTLDGETIKQYPIPRVVGHPLQTA